MGKNVARLPVVLPTFVLSLRGLSNHWRMGVSMALMVAISLLSFLVLKSYQTGLRSDFPPNTWPQLVVLQEDSLGELYGSRLPPSIGDDLVRAGEPWVVAEIHTVVGTSGANAVFLKGIPLDLYNQVEDFHIISGRPLRVGDPARLTMIGAKLAADRGVNPGDVISLRGRDFTVVGIFEEGTYADDEAWVSLNDAQVLLGWGEDVSFYIIPETGVVKEGDHLPGGVAVARRGETGAYIVNEWQPLFDLLGLVANTLAVAAAIALANVLWRIAWLRRHDLAILRSVGFSQLSLAGYLAIQGVLITLTGLVLGLVGAKILSELMRIKTAGFTLTPVVDLSVISGSIGLAGLITLVGAFIPALWLSRFNLAGLLRVE